MTVVTVNLDEESMKKMYKIAKERDLNRSQIVRRALKEYRGGGRRK